MWDRLGVEIASVSFIQRLVSAYGPKECDSSPMNARIHQAEFLSVIAWDWDARFNCESC